MKPDIEAQEDTESTGADAPGPDAVLDAAEPFDEPPNISFREHVVRETLSDLENEMTRDHHLDESGLPAPTGPQSQ
jgi:hypothetical protein